LVEIVSIYTQKSIPKNLPDPSMPTPHSTRWRVLASNRPTLTAAQTPVTVAYRLGLTPKWVKGNAAGECLFIIHVPHTASAIA
jgi:hypothetical protein